MGFSSSSQVDGVAPWILVVASVVGSHRRVEPAERFFRISEIEGARSRNHLDLTFRHPVEPGWIIRADTMFQLNTSTVEHAGTGPPIAGFGQGAS
ncbi:hypothetical protein [Luedemannella helvata]|uniref:hypothetical protein n=1 Tax=Luedemannella helvata TaxID=349315 RepID=UPI0031CFA8C8